MTSRICGEPGRSSPSVVLTMIHATCAADATPSLHMLLPESTGRTSCNQMSRALHVLQAGHACTHEHPLEHAFRMSFAGWAQHGSTWSLPCRFEGEIVEVAAGHALVGYNDIMDSTDTALKLHEWFAEGLLASAKATTAFPGPHVVHKTPGFRLRPAADPEVCYCATLARESSPQPCLEPATCSHHRPALPDHPLATLSLTSCHLGPYAVTCSINSTCDRSLAFVAPSSASRLCLLKARHLQEEHLVSRRDRSATAPAPQCPACACQVARRGQSHKAGDLVDVWEAQSWWETVVQSVKGRAVRVRDIPGKSFLLADVRSSLVWDGASWHPSEALTRIAM